MNDTQRINQLQKLLPTHEIYLNYGPRKKYKTLRQAWDALWKRVKGTMKEGAMKKRKKPSGSNETSMGIERIRRSFPGFLESEKSTRKRGGER